jgi:hypothetical protein
MDSRDLDRQLMQISRQALEFGPDALAALPDGVRAVDCWQNKRYGGMLFWVDTSCNLHGRNAPALRETVLQHDGLSWRSMAAGGSGTETAEKLAAEKGTGLHRLGETTVPPVRLVLAFASPEVHAIELRRARSSASRRRPGRDGFCLMGITDGDPVTYAYALDPRGRPLTGDPLRL